MECERKIKAIYKRTGKRLANIVMMSYKSNKPGIVFQRIESLMKKIVNPVTRIINRYRTKSIKLGMQGTLNVAAIYEPFLKNQYKTNMVAAVKKKSVNKIEKEVRKPWN